MKLPIEIKAIPGQRCDVKNCKTHQWENGVVNTVNIIIDKDKTIKAIYNVTLDRKTISRTKSFPNGKPIIRVVSDDDILGFGNPTF